MTIDKMKALVVEDETWSAMLIVNYLTQLGCVCGKHVTTGEGAVKKAEEEKPDIIFMDIRLADNINGIDSAKRILEKAPDIPIAFMSAFSDNEIVDEAKKLNCVAYLNKPLDINEIKELLESVSQKKSLATVNI